MRFNGVVPVQEFLEGGEGVSMLLVRLEPPFHFPIALWVFDAAQDVFAALEARDEDLIVMPDDSDFADLGFSGFAGQTTELLRSKIAEGGNKAAAARDALTLLLRLARRTA